MGDIVDGILSGIKGLFQSLVETYFFSIFYYAEIIVLWFMALVEKLLMIFTGEEEVLYNGKHNSLIGVFFNNATVRGIYSGMAMLGIVCAFGFAIWAVIRKAFDGRDKLQGVTMGSILGNLFKSIVLIFAMNAIVIASLEFTNKVMKQISFSITYGSELAKGVNYHNFTDEEYAAMGRIFNTIGNYSINPSYRSRYNLNACYNDIRADLRFLGERGVFNFHYVTTDANQQEVKTWQSIMEELATAYDYNGEAPLDTYDKGLTNAILDVMELMKTNPNIQVLKRYERKVSKNTKSVSLDRVLFVAGTMGTFGTAAAHNSAYNKNPSFTDNVRYPFYTGEKSIYNFEEVYESFSVTPWKMNYVLVAFAAWSILKEIIIVVASCGVRIFNLLALYMMAPFAIATMPLDEGGKFKQWSTAFII